MSTPKAANWVAEFTNTTGTGAISLDGPIEGFAPFSVIGSEVQAYYTVQEGNDKEIGLGTIKTNGTLERTRIIATIIDGTYTSGGTAMSLKGFAEVYCTIPAELLNIVYSLKGVTDSIPDSVATKPLVFGPDTFTANKIYSLTRDDDGDFILVGIPISYSAASGDTPATVTIDAKIIANLEAVFKKAVTFEDVVNFNSDFSIGDRASNVQKGFSSNIQNADGQWSMVEFKPSPDGSSADIVFTNEAGEQGIMSVGANGVQIQFGAVDINVTDELDELQNKVQDLQQQIDNIPGGGGDILAVDSVAALKMREYEVGQLVVTRGYYRPGDDGEAMYLIEAPRAVDGFGDHAIANGNTAKLLGGTLYGETFGIMKSKEGVDMLDNMTELCGREQPVKFRTTGMDIYLRDVVRRDNISVDLDLNNNTLVSTGENERCLLFINRLLTTYNVTDITYTGGYTHLTLDSIPTDIRAGGVLKLASDDIINPRSDFLLQRTAEFFVVESIEGAVVKCRGQHIFPHLAGARCAAMNMDNRLSLKNVQIRRDLDPTPAEFTVGINIKGYAYPRTENIRTDYWTGQLLSIANCYAGVFRDTFAEFLLDNAGDNKTGYVAVEYGSQLNQFYNLSGNKVRHVYTTGATDVQPGASVELCGGATKSHIWSGVGYNCSNFAWDTHQDAYGVEFHDVVAYETKPTTFASTGGFQDRAQNTVVHNLTYIEEGDNAGTGGRAIFMNKGAWNTVVHRFNYQGVTGGAIRSFGLDTTNPTLTIGHMTVRSRKRFENFVVTHEPMNVRIRKLDVLPLDWDVGYYSSDAVMFKLGGGASLKVDECNVFFDNPLQPALNSSNVTLCRADAGGATKFHCNIKFHLNPNTYRMWAVNSVLAKTDVGATIDDVLINAEYHTSDWDGTEPGVPAVRNLVGGDIKTTIKYFDNGIPFLSSAFGKDTFFNTTGTLEQGPDKFWNTQCLGSRIDPEFTSIVEAHSGDTRVTTVAPPRYEGQKWRVTLRAYASGAATPRTLTFMASASGLRIPADVVLQPGESIQLIAVDDGTNILWELG